MNFWDKHGIVFIIFLFFFPRLTMLFGDVRKGGIWWWLGWIFLPYLLVALLATRSYWKTNPVLVILTWFWALSGEPFEKTGGTRLADPGGFWRVELSQSIFQV